MKTQLTYLDLEETVIQSFADPTLINIERLHRWLKLRCVDEIGIFSFAIYNSYDRDVFVRTMLTPIEEALGVTIVDIPTIKDMMRADTSYTGLHWDIDFDATDFINARGKQHSFDHYVHVKHPEFSVATLIDDVVPNKTIFDEDKRNAIKLINVNVIGR